MIAVKDDKSNMNDDGMPDTSTSSPAAQMCKNWRISVTAIGSARGENKAEDLL